MNPTPSRIRALLPYALPAALAAVASLLVIMGGGQEGQEAPSVQSVPGSSGRISPRPAADDLVGIPVSGILRDLAPADARVAELLDEYQSGDKSVAVAEMEKLAARPQGKRVEFSLAGMDLSGVIQSRKEVAGGVSMAVLLDDDLGRFTLSLRPGHRTYSTLFFQGEHHAFSFYGQPKDGQWQLAHKTVDTLLCSPAGSTYPARASMAGMPKAKSAAAAGGRSGNPLGAPPDLESDPNSPYVIYIDLDGEVVDQPEWSDQPINAPPHARADDVEFVTRMWERVSEDFAPFNVNVTTSRAVFDAAAADRRMMCVATPDDTAMPGSGGVAYLDSFGSGLVCWAFNDTEDTLAETVSHEVGHTLGLRHDGKVNVYEYYGGHGTGDVSWAPIMGAFFADFTPPYVNEELTQWSKGEYTDATNTEDDLQIITTRNGFSYRTDDYGDSRSDASTLPITEGNVAGSGVIERTTDEDWFQFVTSGGSVSLSADTTNVVSPDAESHGANLALSITIYNSKGEVVVSDNPEDKRDAQISRSLDAGSYFVKIAGEGRRDVNTGFSDYASLGRYFLSGTIPQNGLLRIDPPQMDIPRNGGDAVFNVYSREDWTWSTKDKWITSSSPSNQSGNGSVSYRVSRNGSQEPRVGRIFVRSGDFEVVHLVNQSGPTADDHGDIRPDATLVTQESTTAGDLEEPGDVDMFRIDVEGFGDLTVRTTGITDTFGTFYSADGTILASDDSSALPNFTMTRRVSSGPYYVAVRHSIQGAVGKYNLVCSFKARPGLVIDPPSRRVSASGGRFLINVASNTDWTWSTNSSWIKSSAAGTQSQGQMFAYTVEPYNGTDSRRGQIIFQNKGNSVVHTVTQQPASGDDHTNKRATATDLPIGGRERGAIQFEGDADLFRIQLATSGTLVVESSGRTDTVGELLDKKGNSLLVTDDADSDNFRIRQALGAGTYYVRVTSFGGVQVGSYAVTADFTPSKLVDVQYSAGKGGEVRGALKQTVPLGSDARSVTAVPNRGFSFLRWSDGVRKAKRTDLNILTHLNVTAEFVGTIKVSNPSGEITHNQTPPLDFRTVAVGKSRSMEFTVLNRGNFPLNSLRVVADGFTSSDWRVTRPSRSTLQPGQRATFRIALRGVSPGYYMTQWSIRAQGLDKPFIIKTMGVVQTASYASASLAETTSGSLGASTLAVGPLAPTVYVGESLAGLPWVDVSPDGYFRHRFERPLDDASEQVFWISADGVKWEEALVLDVWKVEATSATTLFEAILAPPGSPAPRILINESSP